MGEWEESRMERRKAADKAAAEARAGTVNGEAFQESGRDRVDPSVFEHVLDLVSDLRFDVDMLNRLMREFQKPGVSRGGVLSQMKTTADRISARTEQLRSRGV